MPFSQQFPKNIETNQKSIPARPQFEKTNPLKKNIFCNGIEIVCSPEFTRKGVMVIFVNNVQHYDSRDSKGFRNTGKLPIPLNVILERDRKVEIFIFNAVDTNLISCTATIFLDEVSKILDSSMQYISDSVVNSLVSDSIVLFPFRVYFNEELTKLLDMKGYSRLIISMAGSTVPDLTIVSQINKNTTSEPLNVVNESESHTFPPYELLVQIGGGFFNIIKALDISNPFSPVLNGSLNAKFLIETITTEIIYDLLTTESHTLEFTFTQPPITSQATFCINQAGSQSIADFQANTRTLTKIQTSQSDLPASGFVIVTPFGADQSTGQKVFGGITKRFVKVEFKIEVYAQYEGQSFFAPTCPNSTGTLTNPTMSLVPSVLATEPFDQNTKNGSGALSFEELNVGDNKFSEFISPAEFGTITEGEIIKVQLGDVNNLSTSGKVYILPSTQTGFRAKFKITGGGVETAVAIRLIA